MIRLLELLFVVWRFMLALGAVLVILSIGVAIVEFARACRWYVRP